jgi:hypothetical protein
MLKIAGWFIVFVIIAFICGFVSSGPLGSYIQNNLTDRFSVVSGDQARNTVQNMFGISFPASATDFYRANRGDNAWWVQFRIPPANLGGLFRNSGFMTCTYPLQDNYKPIFQYEHILSSTERSQTSNWWTPDTARSFVGGECTGRDYKMFRMFADTSNPNLWTFYMEIVRLY